MTWKVGADRNLPIVEQSSWDGDAAKKGIFAWAGFDGDSPDPAKARRCFLVYDDERQTEKGGYKLPFAVIQDGSPKASTAGIRAAASRLPQADIPQDVKDRARKVIDHYQSRMEKSEGDEPVQMRFKIDLPGAPRRMTKARKNASPPPRVTWADLEGAPEVEILGVPFGGPEMGRDSDGEAFHEGTDLWLQVDGEYPVTYIHGFGPDHPMDWQDPPEVIGVAKYNRTDERGVWFRARMDTAKALAKRVMDALEAEKPVRASSGAIGHLVRVRRSGLIDVWPLGEIAVFDVNEWRKPANDFAEVRRAKGEEPVQDDEAIVAVGAVSDIKSDQNDDGGDAMEDRKEQVIDIEQLKSVVMQTLQEQGPAFVQEHLTAQLDEALKAYLAKHPAVAKAMGAAGEDPKMKAFKAWLRGKAAKADLSYSSDGAVLVPDEYSNRLYTDLQEISILRRAGATIVPVSGMVVQVPTLSFGAEAVLTGEATNYGAGKPTVAQVPVSVYKFTRQTVVTEELLNDSRFDVWGALLSPDYANAFATAENHYFTTGTGSNQPEGVLTGATANVVAAASASAITMDDIMNVYFALDYRRRSRAVWMMHDSTIKALLGLQDSTGRPLLIQDYSKGGALTIMGRPVITNTFMPEIAANAKVILFGDFSAFWIVQNTGFSVRRLNEIYATSGQVAFVGMERVGSKVIVPDAFAVLQMAAA